MAQVLPFNGFYTGNSASSSFFSGNSFKNSSRTCVNFMPVRHDAGALSEYTLESTLGIGSRASGIYSGSRSAPVRINSQVITWGGESNASAGEVYTVTDNGILIVTNGIDLIFYDMARAVEAQFGRYRMSSSTAKILIILQGDTDSLIHVYSGDGAIATVDLSGTFSDPLLPLDTVFFGGRFLIMSEADRTNDNNRRVYYSAILDPTTYTQLGFFSSIEQDSNNTGMHVLNNRLYLFSNNSYTVWAVTSDVNLPYQQQLASGGSVGLIEPSAKCEVSGTLYFIGRSAGSVGFFALKGGAYQRISTKEIEQSFPANGSLGFTRCFSFSDQGAVNIAFTVKDSTYCLNLSTGEYHKRSTDSAGYWKVLGSGNMSRESTQTNNNIQVFVGNTCSSTVVGGVTTVEADIAIENSRLGTEFGAQIERECVTSPFNSNGVTNNVRELSFITDIDYSTVTSTPTNPFPGPPSPAVAPQLGLSVSKTFGKTFETEKFSDFDIGTENTKILRFLNIGFFRQAFVFKIKTNNIYPHRVLKMLTKLEKGFRQI
jgi:3D (Asp-Asp-Asp) domain-containing protein